MKPVRIKGATGVLGPPAGWDHATAPVVDLYVRQDVYFGRPTVASAWQPSEEDIANILAGEPIILRIFGTGHPPVMLSTT